jgi:hypothetical protein
MTFKSSKRMVTYFLAGGILVAIAALLAAFGGWLIKQGFEGDTRSAPLGIISGEVHLSDTSDAAGVDVVANPGNHAIKTDSLGHYVFQGLKGAAFSLRFSKEGYHTIEQENVLATEDGSFRPAVVTLNRDTTFGWSKGGALPTAVADQYHLMYSPSGVLVLGTEIDGALYTSADQGRSWTQVLKIPKGEYLSTLSVGFPRGLYVGIFQPQLAPFQGAALESSSNGGESWSRYPIPAAAGEIEMIVAGGGGNVFAGVRPPQKESPPGVSAATIYKSTDGGVSWQPSFTFEGWDVVRPLLAVGDGGLYAATSNDGHENGTKIFASRDAGVQWAPCAQLPAANTIYVKALISTSEKVFVCAAMSLAGAPSNVLQTEIYRTSDPLKSWDLVSRLPGGVSGDTSPLLFDPVRRRLYLTQESTLLRSDDFGSSWQIDFRDEGGAIPRAVAIDPSGRLYLIVTSVLPNHTTRSRLWISTPRK